MMELYKAYPYKEKFFDKSQSKEIGDINKLAGVAAFKEQIEAGTSEEEIRKTWEPGLSQYKEMRKNTCCTLNHGDKSIVYDENRRDQPAAGSIYCC
jgi:uncharacterized protein YbbC (DUF1343 family)